MWNEILVDENQASKKWELPICHFSSFSQPTKHARKLIIGWLGCRWVLSRLDRNFGKTGCKFFYDTVLKVACSWKKERKGGGFLLCCWKRFCVQEIEEYVSLTKPTGSLTWARIFIDHAFLVYFSRLSPSYCGPVIKPKSTGTRTKNRPKFQAS